MTSREYKYHRRKREMKFLWNIQGLVAEYQLAYFKEEWRLADHYKDKISIAAGVPVEELVHIPIFPTQTLK